MSLLQKPLALEVKSLKKSYLLSNQKIEVLKGIDLTVSAGRWVSFTGPSGCGKTTFLQLLGALDKPDEGSIKCFGQSITKLNSIKKAKLRRTRLGFIFQSYQLFSELDALENVSLPGRLGGDKLKDIIERAESLLLEMGLKDRLHHRPAELSGGEQQRIAIARALMNQPDIVLADEPTGNLDDKNSADIMEILSNLRNKEDKTIIMVTHDLNLTQYSDQTYIFKEGRLASTESAGQQNEIANPKSD